MKYAILVSCICLFSVSLFGQADDPAQINKVLKAQETAWNKGDIDEFMLGYWNNDSLLFIGSQGIQYGFNSTLSRYKKTYESREKMGKLTFDIIQVAPISADTYRVLGKWQLVRTMGNAGGYFTLLFKKINGAWKVIYDHTS